MLFYEPEVLKNGLKFELRKNLRKGGGLTRHRLTMLEKANNFIKM